MPDIWYDVDTALAEVPINIFPLIDDTDFKSREVSVVFNAAGLDLVWNFTTTAGAFTQTAVTPTDTAGNYDWVNQGDGIYTIEIPASGGASINNDTEGFGWFTGVATGVLPWRGPIIGFRAAALNNSLIDGTTIDVNLTAIGGVTQSATDLKDFADDGYDPSTNKVQGVVLTDTVTTYTGNTPQTGDAFARLGAPAGASVSADIAAIEAQTDDIGANGAGLTAIPWNAAWDAEVESEATDALNAYDPPTRAELTTDTNSILSKLLKYVQLILRKDSAIATDNGTELTAINADGGSGTGAYANTTDSQEAIRDRGDASWITATGFSTHSAADVWAVATRLLTAGTNIVLAKGVGVTGFNDLSAAQVNAEADTALSDYDPPTHAELVSEIDAVQADIAALNNLSAAQVNAEVDTALADINLDHLVGTATGIPAVPAGTYLDQIMDDGTASYDRTTDSLQAIADSGGGGPTAGQIADAVWDEVLSGHLGAGSAGEALDAAGTAGDPWLTALPGAYGAGTAGKIIGDNINATVSSRASQASLDTVDDFLDTEIAAILADTNELQTDWVDGGRLDLILDARASQASVDTIDTNVDAILVDTGTDGVVVAAASKTGYALSAAGVQAIWDALTSALTTVNSIGKLLTDNINAAISSRSSHSAADVWSVATRLLTAGTNIVLAKGVGVTGFNDLSTAQVNTEVDTALADYDAPTSAELVSEINSVQADIAALNNLSAAQVNAEVVDALAVDTYAEPGQEAPPATTTLAVRLRYLYKGFRNRYTQTTSEFNLFADDAVTVDQKATVSDNGTTFDRGEIGSGP